MINYPPTFRLVVPRNDTWASCEGTWSLPYMKYIIYDFTHASMISVPFSSSLLR
nr:hypothetical protein Q903MT_gene3357 [Picea sitchensis]